MMIGFEQYKQRWGVDSERAIKPGLEAMQLALYCLGNPQYTYPVIHLAGTNGKGSTLTFIESIAMAHGLRVGKFMSPCIVDIHDQIQVDRMPISVQQMDSIFQELKHAGLSGKLTDFELLTVVAFKHFQKEQVDLVLLEAGMGGLLDSTNVVMPVVSVITSIALEHTNFLGDTLAKIASHKAGIIKRERPVIVGRVDQEALEVIRSKAEDEQAMVYVLGGSFDVLRDELMETYTNSTRDIAIGGLKRQMAGPHQADNMALAISALIEAASVLNIQLQSQKIRKGVAAARIPGRFEEVLPSVYFDGAHNPASAEKLVATIREEFPGKKIRFIVGMLADKDVQSVLHILEQASDDFIFVDFDNRRAMKAEKMMALSNAGHKEIVGDVIHYLHSCNKEKEIIVVTGSLYLLASLRQRLLQ